MKKSIFAFLFCLVGICMLGQENLEVTYEGYVRMKPPKERHQNNPQKQAEFERNFEAATKIPSFHILTIQKDEASFSLEERINNQQPNEKMMVQIRFTASSDLYKNISDNSIINVYPVGSKTYTIKDSLIHYDWKITQEKREILGFEVRKATALYENLDIEAWYAPKLPFKHGPAEYWGLPGLILELTQVNRENPDSPYTVFFIANKIDPQSKSKLKKFEKFELITQEEYDQKLDDLLKTYQEMHQQKVVID